LRRANRKLWRGAQIAVFAPASPGSEAKVTAGIAELRRLGFVVELPAMQQPEGYFAASTEARGAELVRLLGDTKVDGVIGVRGGYGSNYLLGPTLAAAARAAKVVLGFSDLTSVQIFLWQQCGWVTFYGRWWQLGSMQERALPVAMMNSRCSCQSANRLQGGKFRCRGKL